MESYVNDIDVATSAGGPINYGILKWDFPVLGKPVRSLPYLQTISGCING
jgi:hypothetical protein